MTILGKGTANGGISVLHAAGLGRGCSVGIELQCEARLVEGASSPSSDHHGLLDAVMQNQAIRDSILPVGRLTARFQLGRV